MGGPPARLTRMRQSTPHLKTASTKKERRVSVIGNSLLRRMEGPICQPILTCREVCCLLGTHVRDISRKHLSLILLSDYYPLLIVQANSNEVAEKSLRTSKKDVKGLGQLVGRAGVQDVLSSIHSVSGKDTDRSRKNLLINTWLRGWCSCKNFGFFFTMGWFTLLLA